MFSNDCSECKNLAKSLEKKQETLTVYQTNLYEIKARIINENTLLNNYKFFKNENEQLKKEIEQLKSQSVTGKNSQINYEIELLRNKYLKELDNNKNLLLINNQLSAIMEDNKKNPEQRAEKERKINNLLLLNENLKKEIKDLKAQMRSKEQEEKLSNKTNENININNHDQNTDKKLIKNEIKENKIEKKDDQNINFYNDNSFERFTKNSVFSYENNQTVNDVVHVANGINTINKNFETEQKLISSFNPLHNLNANVGNFNNLFNAAKKQNNRDFEQFNNANNQNIKNILEENEYMKNKYQKYEKKYIKHKSVSKCYKKLLKNLKKENEKEKEFYISKIFEMKLKTISSRQSHADNYNQNKTKNIKIYKDEVSSSEEEKEKSEFASNVLNYKSEDLSKNKNRFNQSRSSNSEKEKEEKIFQNNTDPWESKQHKEKSLESLLNNSDSEGIENEQSAKNKNPIMQKSSNKISSIKNMIAKMKFENKLNSFPSLNEQQNNKNDSINFLDFYKKADNNLNENSFESLSGIESAGKRKDKANPMIDNFNNDDKNFLFLKKKIIRKKAAKTKKIDDVYEKFKEENANQRRSMRVKINSLRTDTKTKAKVKKNIDIKEEGDEENFYKPKVKVDKKQKIKKSKNENEKEKDEFLQKAEKIQNINNKKNKVFAFSIADMLKRNREGENVSFQVTNVIEDHEELKKSRIKAEKSTHKNKIKENILVENLKKLKAEENNNASKNKNKKVSKKELERANKMEIEEAEMLLDDMEIPKSNNIIKANEIKGSHKNPLKYNKKITAAEVTEIKTKKIKLDLLEYVKNKINLIDIYKNIIDNQTKENSLAEEISKKFDIFSLVSFDINNIFNQKIEVELINNIKLSEYSLYEKINFVFDLVLESAESLEIGNVFVFVFSFLKDLLKKEAAAKSNELEVLEIIFGYFTVKINEILSDETFRNKSFLNNFSNSLNLEKEQISSKEAANEVIKMIFKNVFLDKENDDLLERIFIKNEFLNVQYFFSYNFVILFYLSIENFYFTKNPVESSADIALTISNLDYFRLMQDFLLGINYSEKSQIGSESSSNNESLTYAILQKIFELFCLFTDKINVANLHTPESLYDKKLFSNSNKIMFAENLKDKVFTCNFFYIIRKIFLCDSDQINFNLQLPSENNENKNFKEEEIKTIKKQNLILQIFGNLYLSFIPNVALTSNEKTFSLSDFNSKFNLLKIVELTQFIELAMKIHKIPLVYGSVFEQVLWPEFTKQGQPEFTRRIVLYLISILFKFVLKEDSMFKNEQTKNLMNWLYAIVDPKFDVEKILPIDRIISLYGLIDLCKFDQTFINAIKAFVVDVLKSSKIEDFPVDLREKLLNKFGLKLESFVQPVNNSSTNENEDKKDAAIERIIVANR